MFFNNVYCRRACFIHIRHWEWNKYFYYLFLKIIFGNSALRNKQKWCNLLLNILIEILCHFPIFFNSCSSVIFKFADVHTFNTNGFLTQPGDLKCRVQENILLNFYTINLKLVKFAKYNFYPVYTFSGVQLFLLYFLFF